MFGFSLPRFVTSVIRWVDAHATENHDTGKDHHQVDWIQSLPFFIMPVSYTHLTLPTILLV